MRTNSAAGPAGDDLGRSGAPAVDEGRDEVAVLHWPAEAGAAAALAEQGRPRLLLVSPDADPPVSDDWRQEWVRLPADERDVAARVLRLTRWVERPDPTPRLDATGRLFVGERWVALSPIESRLAEVLTEHFGSVVSDADLVARGWSPEEGAGPGAGALRVHVTRLRRRLAPLDLEIRTVRGRGCILQSTRSEPMDPRPIP